MSGHNNGFKELRNLLQNFRELDETSQNMLTDITRQADFLEHEVKKSDDSLRNLKRFNK